MLMWLAERMPIGRSPSMLVPPQVFCASCGHGVEQHAQEDDSCRFPMGLGAPVRLCRCETFVLPELG